MRLKRVLWVLPFVVGLASTHITSAVAGPISKKLGYGFAPGLVAGKDYIAGQLIVGLKEGGSATTVRQAATRKGGRVNREIRGAALLVEFPSEAAAVGAVDSLAALPDVLFIERNGFMHIPPTPTRQNLRKEQRGGAADHVAPLSVSNDPGAGHQWHLTVIRKTAALPALSATPPTVAVIDTGVDYTHSDLSGKVLLGRNTVANTFDPFDDNGHGTHVAGLIAAKAANSIDGEGICPNCKILAVKVLGADGFGSFFDIATGMHYAHTVVTNPVTKVLNMSLGGPSSALIATEVDHIKAAGKVLVAAAGNDNTTSTTSAFPGADPDTAFRVMATEENDCRTFFSNFSPSAAPTQYNIAAPGFHIYSTTPNEGFESFDGTSMASPIVAGAAALVWGQLPTLTRDQLVARVVNTGKAINCGFAATTRRLDVRRAILGTAETAVVGRILDPFTGNPPSPNTAATNARLFSGASQVAVDGTNRGGSYEMTGLTAGVRTLKGDRAGYVNDMLRTLSIVSGGVIGPMTDALPVARATGHATVTLDWKTTQPDTDTSGCSDTCNGWDFDLLVKLPAGSYIDPFVNPGDLITSPFVRNPRDSLNDSQPLETIVINAAAANGVYKVVIDRWYSPTGPIFNPSWVGSQASVRIYNGATPIPLFYGAPPASCTTSTEFWHVGNLTKNGATYTWTNVNTCTNTKP
ncbi:MAG TPA: S8 family serine peptidase [Methylomirabilota bacterium]|nr:S8 family serine peptidase [Methylomirabilota bacterium]